MRYEKTGFPTDNRQPITGNQITGKISQMFYSSPDFSSGVIKTKDGTAKFAGKLMVNLNDRVTFGGSWKKHDKYGWQFLVTTLQHDLNLDAKGLAHYLKTNPAFKGIGPVKAERIATNFGEDFDRALREEPEEIRRVAGLSKQDIETLQCEWQKRKEFNVLSAWLGKYELTHNQITRLIEKFGYSVKAILLDDPYILCREIDGFGFARTDQIARKMGISKNLPGRIQAALLHVVARRIDEGHCWTEEQELVEMASELLALDDLDFRERIEEQVDALVTAKRFVGHNTNERMLIADPVLYKREMDLARVFTENIKNLPATIPHEELAKLIETEAADLTPTQQQAVKMTLSSRISLISGAGGTGKSYTIAAIVRICESLGLSVALAAPTGKAAKRMEELSDCEAMTIHRLLGYDGLNWKSNAKELLAYDVIILDECFDYKQTILTEDGWRYIGVVVNNEEKIRVWSRNPENGHLELKPILRWIKRPSPEKMLKISASRAESTRSSRIIRCTNSHKILTPYGYRCAEDLCVGEEIIVRGYQLTSEQRSILIGSILGDGCLNARNGRKSPQVVITHGEAQREYLAFKQRAFGVLAGEIKRGKSGYTKHAVWRLNINVFDELYEIAKEMVISGRHPSGRKRWTPTNKFLELIDEQALAVWYLDNGSLSRRRLAQGGESVYASIHSERFSEEDNYRLADYLNRKFGLTPRVSNDSRGNYLLRFSKSETAQLLNIILPFVPSCMNYKIFEEAKYEYEPKRQVETTIARIQTIEEVQAGSSHVYDIEVAEHHNYVAGNIVVSNCSMVDVNLAWRFFDAVDIKTTQIILVGDHNQLPPVGPGNILRDLIDRKLIPTVILDRVVRQAGILKENSAAILSGKVNPTAPGSNGVLRPWYVIDNLQSEREALSALLEIVENKLVSLGIDPLRDLQVLAPIKKGTLGVANLNIELQRLIQRLHFGVQVEPVADGKRPKFYCGDKVMQMKNNYNLGVMNGHLGFVNDIRMEDDDDGHPRKVWEIDFDWRLVTIPVDSEKAKNLQLAYACTIHKYQGSEVPCALTIVHSSHYFMLHRNLLYTAVTRARKTAILLGDCKGIQAAAARQLVEKRKTFLSIFSMEIV